jgi:hypothetical protein
MICIGNNLFTLTTSCLCPTKHLNASSQAYSSWLHQQQARISWRLKLRLAGQAWYHTTYLIGGPIFAVDRGHGLFLKFLEEKNEFVLIGCCSTFLVRIDCGGG